MARKPPFRAVAKIDPDALASFQAGIRKRYSDDQILQELRASAERLGRSPTMREFAADPDTAVHPQTVIEHFGSWNAAKREAGLVPRRFATREELVGLLRELGEELGRVPTAKDLDARRGSMPSKSLYWHTFGSLAEALREAGFDVPLGEERLERAVEQGVELARKLERLPKFADWASARRKDEGLLTEWQVYRMFDARRGAWSTFQFLIKERLDEEGMRVGSDGNISERVPKRKVRCALGVLESQAAATCKHARRSRQERPSSGARTAGSGSSSNERSGSNDSRATIAPLSTARIVPSRSSLLRNLRPT